MRSRRRHVVHGLTLFEVIIAIALMGMLVGALMTFFWQTLAVRDAAALAADRTHIVHQVLQRMADEMQACAGVEKINFPVRHFVGERRRITFVTSPLPPPHSYAFFRESEDRPLPGHDLREITYELWIDPHDTTEDNEPLVGGILRTERRALEPYETEEDVPEDEDLLYVRRDLWSHELGYLEFRYFDGVEWSTQWQVTEGNPLPHLVQITVGFDSLTRDELDDQDLEQYPLDRDHYPLGPDVPEPNRYRKIVRLRAADQMFATRLSHLSGAAEEIYRFGEEVDEFGELIEGDEEEQE